MPASALLNNTRVASASARGRLSTHCRNLRGSEGKPGGNATGSALGNAMNAAWIRLMRQLSPEYALLAGSTDRKSVVWGKSVSVRVDLGGRRSMHKKKYEREKGNKQTKELNKS